TISIYLSYRKSETKSRQAYRNADKQAANQEVPHRIPNEVTPPGVWKREGVALGLDVLKSQTGSHRLAYGNGHQAIRSPSRHVPDRVTPQGVWRRTLDLAP